MAPAVSAAHCVGRLAEHVAPRELEHVARDLAHGRHLAIEQVGEQLPPEAERPAADSVRGDDELRAAVRLLEPRRLAESSDHLACPAVPLCEHLRFPLAVPVAPALLEVVERAVHVALGRGGSQVHLAQLLGRGGRARIVPGGVMPVQEDAQLGQIVVKGADVAQVDGVLMKDIGHHVPDEGGRQALMDS